MTRLDTLQQEGQQLLADILRDIRECRLATTFTGGFGDAVPRVADPGTTVYRWADRVVAAAMEDLGAASCFADIPECKRKALETDSSLAVRCLKLRLHALEQLRCRSNAAMGSR